MRIELKCFHDDGYEQIFKIEAAKISLTNGIREVPPREAMQDWREFEKYGSILLKISGRVHHEKKEN